MPATRQMPDVIVVGAGFAGMYAIYRLRAAGLSVHVVEAGSDVGGTWYWNRYPGARCDVPSLEYSFGFSPELEQEWDWPEVFSAQPDILRYANHIADRFDLRRDITFNTRIRAVDYRDATATWRLTAEDGRTWEAPFCIMATGCLSVPMKPELPGADTFRGRVLHTGAWPAEPVDLAGKRVGIIGTGSSGVQAIPELAREAAHLTVFQRTPVYTMPANRKAMRDAVQQEFKDNYRQIRSLQQANAGGVSNFRPTRSVNTHTPTTTTATTGFRAGGGNLLDLTPEERRARIARRGLGELLTFRDVYTNPEANDVANALYREGVHHLVQDPETAERLCPKDYGIGCKRQVLDRDFYATFNRDNVTLVNLRETPIESITPSGLRTSAGDHELDVLIYATGFDAMTGALLRANITGRDGTLLADKWRYGPVTYLGLQMRGFPNLFTVTGPGSPSVLCNMLVAIEQHVNWIADCITWMQATHHATIEPLDASEDDWIAHVNAVAEGTMYTAPSCNSWYLGANIPGKPRIFMPYVGGYPRYKARCDAETASNYAGFEVL
ncbi:MAG: NAD(P)/FAD-dependent oxidoreductase [Pseudomonadales bacterium]|nr:NAD(P)/FAD-dependent oxidoreductase [Pseudomonadales bacterium]